MPLDTKSKSQPGRTSFHDILHKVFLDARQNMHLARKAEGTAEWTVKQRAQARNNAYAAHSFLFQMAQKGELSASLFKDLNDLETNLHELNAELIEAEATFGIAKQKYASRVASYQQAKANCEGAGCQQSHYVADYLPETSKEYHKARKAAKEQHQEGWRQESEARKRRNDENAQQKDRSRQSRPEGSKPPGEGQDSWSRSGSRQDEPSSGTRRKRPHPTSPEKPIPKPPTYREWISTAEEAFRDYTSLSSFPSPPARVCSKPSCKSETRVLAACACNIRQGLNHLTVTELKAFRLLFHPDRFSKCHADLIEGFKRQASAVFVVLNAMYNERK